MATVGSMCMRSAHKISRITNSLLFRPVVSRSDLKFSTAQENSQTSEPPAVKEAPETNSSSDVAAKKEAAETKSSQETTKQSEADIKLTEENEKLEKKLKEMKEKYLRSLAETENVRTRMRKQVDDAKHFGIQSFCKDLLDVADTLGRATESVPKEELTNQNIHLKNLFDGLTMTSSELQKVFSKHGLVQIQPSEGDVFDPFIHEAMFEVPTPDKDMGSKIAVIQKLGYKLSDRTIRPAQVGVFKS